MTVIPKCQARTPELCIHPDCPERRGIREALEKASNYNEYEAAMKLQEADNERVKAAKIKLGINHAEVIPLSPDSLRPAPKPMAPRPGAPKLSTHEQRLRIKALIRNDIRRYQANDHEGRDRKPIIRFHKDIGFPWHFKAVTATVPLQYSAHALDESNNDRYDRIPVLDKLNLGEAELIEVKYNRETGEIEKMLYRKQGVKDGLDGCFVLRPSTSRDVPWQVVTAWFNESNDRHGTLNRNNYASPKPRVQPEQAKQAA